MKEYLMRSLMFVPGHSNKLLQSAAKSEADVLLIDIEDSVQPVKNKQIAREKLIKYIKGGSFDGRIIFPRINDRESGQLLKDVTQLAIEGVEGFMYPKAKTGKDIYFFVNF
jgi:citrate lyase subunit beta/citryl-CoA lyase